MDKYSIYWIKEDIAAHYYYKSDILYRFINQYLNHPHRVDLRAQYAYITHHFHLNQMICLFLDKTPNLSIQINKDTIEIHKRKQHISLQICDKHLKFHCQSLDDAEELLFPVLREFQSNLFIVGRNIPKFGWISPLISVSKYDNRQVLYS